jgi:hypothetical protein
MSAMNSPAPIVRLTSRARACRPRRCARGRDLEIGGRIGVRAARQRGDAPRSRRARRSARPRRRRRAAARSRAAPEHGEIVRPHAACEEEVDVAHERRRRPVGDDAPSASGSGGRRRHRVDLVLDGEQHECSPRTPSSAA